MAQVRTAKPEQETRYRGECAACGKWGALRAGVCRECERDAHEADALLAAQVAQDGGYIQ